ncbi:MAG: thrombospondin type 3 repeat-containing protein, partial [Candidatus Dormibacteria bacterium]
AAAAKKMLGTVAGRQVLNRVTPLFRLYSAAAQDTADITSPQGAIALIINSVDAYQPQGQPVPGYPSFPGITATPKAAVYVLTTEFTPQIGYPPLVPLYQMDRARNWPLGCTGGSGCNTNHRDFTLMTTTADVQQAHADGFNLRNIQGYIYQQCSPEPQCIPPAAQKFYRECNTAIDDCATFLESERATFEANGYTTAYPATSSKVLGYAYPSTDSDGDGLVDGMEYVIGTNPFLAQSGGAGISDGQAYPMAGVEVVDPCLGPGAINCPANFIFKNGFE